MEKRIHLPQVYLSIFLILTTSCQSTMLQSPTGVLTPYPKSLSTLTTSTLASTSTGELTPYTPTTSAPRPTETVSPQITITPFPIQELNNKGKMDVMDILNEKLSCHLPCWLGVTPGVSSAYEVQALYAKLGQQIPEQKKLNLKDSDGITLKISNYPKGYLDSNDFFVSTEWQSGTITKIMVRNWGHPEQFEIKKIADTLGEPDFIKVNKGTSGDIPLYNIALIFEKRNTIIELTGKAKLTNRLGNAQFDACIFDHNSQSVDFILYSDAVRDSVLEEYSGNDIPWAEWQKEIGMSKSELYDLMSNSQQCLAYP